MLKSEKFKEKVSNIDKYIVIHNRIRVNTMTSNRFLQKNELKSSQKTIWRNVQRFNKSKIFTYSFHNKSGCFKIQMVSVALELQKSRCSSSQMLSKVRVVFSTHASIKVKSFLSFRKKRKKISTGIKSSIYNWN